jgi:hypothetical protein
VLVELSVVEQRYAAVLEVELARTRDDVPSQSAIELD